MERKENRSFTPETEQFVNELIQEEYNNACKQFGDNYNSLHEGYAALLEEVEKVEVYFSKIHDICVAIKQNKTENLEEYFDAYTLRCVENSIRNLAKVEAVLIKIKNTFGDLKKCSTVM